MIARSRHIPPGPAETYDPSTELLGWLWNNFRRFGDIYRASIFGTDVYVVSTPHYAEHVLRKNWQNYVKGQAIKRVALLLGNGLMVSEGEFWKSQRQMIQPAFRQQAIGSLIGVIAAANSALLRKWQEAARAKVSVNVTRDVSLTVLETTLAAIFGEDYEQVAPPFAILTEETARDLRFAQAFRSLGKIVAKVIARRRQESKASADMLGMLMQATDRESGQAMSDRQLVKEVMTLIVAGHETTAASLNWIWYLLSQHPKVAAKLSRELETFSDAETLRLGDLPKFAYTRQVIDETLRLYPPGWLMTRRALQDDHLGEYFVPAGTEIYISPYIIQRHSDFWENADRFDPGRFDPDRAQDRHPLALLPFSAGPRNCVGEHFARVEMQIHLMTVAKSLQLRYGETKPPELDAGVNLRSKNDFVMRPSRKTAAKS